MRWLGHAGYRWLSHDRIWGFETGLGVEGNIRPSAGLPSFDPLASAQLEIGLSVFQAREFSPTIYMGPEAGIRFWNRPGGSSPEPWFGGRLGFGFRGADRLVTKSVVQIRHTKIPNEVFNPLIALDS